MIIEMALTVGLVSTILGTASRAQNVGPLSAVAVGAYIALAGLWASPVRGASMNPARSFGPDLSLTNFAHYWVYAVGPIAGGVIAVGFAWLLRGRGGDVGGLTAAQGAVAERIVEARRRDEAGSAGPAGLNWKEDRPVSDLPERNTQAKQPEGRSPHEPEARQDGND